MGTMEAITSQRDRIPLPTGGPPKCPKYWSSIPTIREYRQYRVRFWGLYGFLLLHLSAVEIKVRRSG